jgi:hypothetical protein
MIVIFRAESATPRISAPNDGWSVSDSAGWFMDVIVLGDRK